MLQNISPPEEANYTLHLSTNTFNIYFLTFSVVHSFQQMAPFYAFPLLSKQLKFFTPSIIEGSSTVPSQFFF